MDLRRYTAQEWNEVSESMHSSVFNEFRPKELNRIDYVLAVWDGDIPVGYVTCTEFDSKTIYMGYGGVMNHQKKSFKVLSAYMMILDWLKSYYLRVNTLIENNNVSMLKMALSAGFAVTGLRYFKGSILLEHSMEWGK